MLRKLWYFIKFFFTVGLTAPEGYQKNGEFYYGKEKNND